MKQQAQPDEHGQSAQFRDAVHKLTHEWGFVVVVTAIATDAARSAALEKLHACTLSNRDTKAGFDRGTLALPTMLLEDADYDTSRAAFGTWVRDYDGHEEAGAGEDGGGDDGGWASDVRRDVLVVLDGPALESLLLSSTGGREDAAWVVVVDARRADDGGEAGRPDYAGWMRCLAVELGSLSDDLDAIDEGMCALCPPRRHSGQIPLYDGSPQGRLLEPASGSEGGGTEFPRGTQRGTSRGTQRGATGGTQRGP